MERSSERNDAALAGATGSAPNDSALLRISCPSVPLRPTAPPMPAIGLTMKPTVLGEECFSELEAFCFSIDTDCTKLFNLRYEEAQ
jgi:hypothetical protein